MKPRIVGLSLASLLAGCGQIIGTCVARGSRVRVPGGERNVEDLREGDEIVVVEPETGELAVSTITAIRRARRECGTLSFAGRTLSVTSDHPVYDPIAKGFFPAGDWLLGTRTSLRDVNLGVITVEATERFSRIDEVFDLTVAHEWHTFVAEGIVVHNKQPVSCARPTGERVEYGSDPIGRPLCTCADGGVGMWTCETSSTATCSFCGKLTEDGGIKDAGP